VKRKITKPEVSEDHSDHHSLQAFPEVDRAEWFDLEISRSKILSGQIELIDRLEEQAR
jgi:predicted NUDIX family NTP pyrophosphohydrolase